MGGGEHPLGQPCKHPAIPTAAAFARSLGSWFPAPTLWPPSEGLVCPQRPPVFTCRNGQEVGGKLSAPHMGWYMPWSWGNCMGSGSGEETKLQRVHHPRSGFVPSVGV